MKLRRLHSSGHVLIWCDSAPGHFRLVVLVFAFIVVAPCVVPKPKAGAPIPEPSVWAGFPNILPAICAPKAGVELPNKPPEGICVPPSRLLDELVAEAPAKTDKVEGEVPPAGDEPKIDGELPEPKRDEVADGPEEPKIEGPGADVEPNKDKLGVDENGALAEVKDPDALKEENGVDPDKSKEGLPEEPVNGAAAEVTLASRPAACVES